MVDWVAAAYGLCVPLQVIFGFYALLFALHAKRRRHTTRDTEDFVTARASQGVWRIGWSFFAGAVGAWAIVTPGAYGSFAGIVGVVVYAVTAGLPILAIAFAGDTITRALPHVFSLSDYIGWRFGPIAKTMVTLVAMFNMSISMVAEYTTLGSLFSDFVGSVNWGIVLSVAVITLTYTVFGGLLVSIATDQVQGAASLLLTLVLTIYVAVTYRYPIPDPLPSFAAGDAFDLGVNVSGLTSIFTLSVSLLSATVFSEAMWQRVWASESKRTVRMGALFGCCTTIIVVFLSGFGGWLAMAAGLATADTNPNLYLFQLFSSTPNGAATLNSWVSLIALGLAVVMNEGAVDSLQNGLAAAISGMWLKTSPLLHARIAVIVINVPIAVVATFGYSVLSLFLITNLLCSSGAVPVLLGLWQGGRRWLSETSFVVGFLSGILGVTALGIGLKWDGNDVGGSFAAGADWAWYSNNYDWRAFLTTICCSTGAMLLWAAAAAGLERCGVRGPGVSGLLMRVPGMRWLTGTPKWDAQGVYLDTYDRPAGDVAAAVVPSTGSSGEWAAAVAAPPPEKAAAAAAPAGVAAVV